MMAVLYARFLSSAFLFLTLLCALPVDASAQSGWEIRYRFTPAITGNNTRVLIGQQNGTILHYTSSRSGLTLTRTLRAGAELPSGVEGIWQLSMPDPASSPELVVGLANYTEEGTKRYGIIRSSDLGDTWQLIKPAPLASSVYTVYTGRNDFRKLTLARFHWLNAQRGWLYGCNGILTTNDGGQTWTNVYTTTKADSLVGQIAFVDEMNGVATLGDYHMAPFYSTTDGGATWSYSYRPTFAYRLAELTYSDGQYRMLALDPFQLTNNTYMFFSTDGKRWTTKTNTFYMKIGRGQTEMSELLWAGNKSGYMALRSGEIWSTTDGGLGWTNLRTALDTATGSRYKVMSGSMGSDSAFAQATILLRNSDGEFLVQAVTGSSTGELQYVEQFSTGAAPASVGMNGVAAAKTLQLYPNPASSEIELSFNLPVHSKVAVRLIDPLGREVGSYDLGMMGAGEQWTRLSVESLTGGYYRCIVVAGEERFMQSLVIAR